MTMNSLTAYLARSPRLLNRRFLHAVAACSHNSSPSPLKGEMVAVDAWLTSSRLSLSAAFEHVTLR